MRARADSGDGKLRRGPRSESQAASIVVIIAAAIILVLLASLFLYSVSAYNNKQALKKRTFQHQRHLKDQLDVMKHDDIQSGLSAKNHKRLDEVKERLRKERDHVQRKVDSVWQQVDTLEDSIDRVRRAIQQRHGVAAVPRRRRRSRGISRAIELVKAEYSVEAVRNRERKHQNWLLMSAVSESKWKKLISKKVADGVKRGLYGLKGASKKKQQAVIDALCKSRVEFVNLYKKHNLWR